MRPTRSPMARAETTIAVTLRPREIDALLVAAHMAMDSLPADDEAALERAADRAYPVRYTRPPAAEGLRDPHLVSVRSSTSTRPSGGGWLMWLESPLRLRLGYYVT
jgi:hypothetical protein